MSESLWGRAKATVAERYERSAVAHYGAGLGCDCGECPTGPETADIPVQRPGGAVPEASSEPASERAEPGRAAPAVHSPTTG